MAKPAFHPRRSRRATPTMSVSIDNSEDESGTNEPSDDDYGDVGEFSPGSNEPEPDDNDDEDKRGN